MTFLEMQSELLGRLNLSSSEATTRLKNALNWHNRRVTAMCGLQDTRFTTISVNTSAGTRTITAQEIERADRVIDATTASSIRVLDQISIDEMRKYQTTSGRPTKWATQSVDADAVVILFDYTPDATYAMRVDGPATQAALSANGDESVIPESFHHILVWSVLSEELMRKGHKDEAIYYQTMADRLTKDLQFHLADAQILIRQANSQNRRYGLDTGLY